MAGAALLAVNVHCLAGELGLEGPLHITGLQINRVFKQMVLRRAPYKQGGSGGRGGSFWRAPPSSDGGVSEAGQASRRLPPPSPWLPNRLSPWSLGVRKSGVPFPCGPQHPLCTARELGGGGHTGPLVHSQGHTTAWNIWKRHEAFGAVTGIRGATASDGETIAANCPPVCGTSRKGGRTPPQAESSPRRSPAQTGRGGFPLLPCLWLLVE